MKKKPVQDIRSESISDITPQNTYDLSEWTEFYNTDRIQLLAIDPNRLYAYWSVSDRKKWLCAQHFELDWFAMAKIIRIYNTTDLFFDGTNANHFFDIPVGESLSWQVHHLNPDSTYVADFGTYNIFGQFIPIMRSHAVKTPRNAVVHGAPIVSTVTEVQQSSPSGHIRSAFFENFATLNNYNSKGSV
jgi:hypothetical protein